MQQKRICSESERHRTEQFAVMLQLQVCVNVLKVAAFATPWKDLVSPTDLFSSMVLKAAQFLKRALVCFDTSSLSYTQF